MEAPAIASFGPARDGDEFRAALSRFATGVTVVTAMAESGPVGITANSFTSVSLDPPLVLWCPAKASRRYPLFSEANAFVVHILAHDQRDLCAAFTRDAQAFDAADWSAAANGAPLIAGAAASFECDTHAIHDAGDHALILGRVTRAHHAETDPLVFHGGRYGAFHGVD